MSLTIQPFAELRELDSMGRPEEENVSKPERIASLTAGAGLVAFGATRRSWWGWLLALAGGALMYRGGSGHCEVYRRLGVDTARPHAARGVPDHKGVKVEQTVFLERQPEQVYRYWRRIENLPRFMPHLISVEEKNDRISHWVANGPGGTKLEWDAEILVDREGELISWESIPGAQVENAGSVWFQPQDGGTRVKLSMKYNPPAGMLGATVAKILGQAPEQQLASDLKRFKKLLENEEQFLEWEFREGRSG